MTGQQFRNSILQEAIQGRLVPNVLEPGEKTGAELLQQILEKRQKKENEEKGRKAKRLTLSTIEEEPWELPEGWCWTRLGNLVRVIGGTSYAKSDIRQEGIRILRGGNIQNLKMTLSDDDVFVDMELLDAEKNIRKGDIIIVASTGSQTVIGKPAFIDSDLEHTQIGAFLRIVRSNALEMIPYIKTIFSSNYYREHLHSLIQGTNILNLKGEYITDFAIPLPPLSIQKAIVSKIEELFPLVHEYDKAAVELNTLNNLLPDKLRKSVLQEAIHGNLIPNDIPDGEATAPELLQQILKERQNRENKEKGKKAKKLSLSTIEEEPWELPEGWCWCRLGDVGEFTRGNGIKKDEVIPEGFPCVRYGELYTRYRIQFSSTFSHVNEAIYNRSQKIENGDVVMALTGENEYDIALASVYLGTTPVAMGGDMTKLHPFIDSKYLVYVINSPYGIECKSLLATGQIIVHISNDKLASIQIPLTPLSIQHRIVEKIEEVFAVIDKLQT